MNNIIIEKVIWIIAIVSCADIWTISYLLRQDNQKLTFKPEFDFTEKIMTDPSLLLKRLGDNIDQLEKKNMSSEPTESTGTKVTRYVSYMKRKKDKRREKNRDKNEKNAKTTLYSILSKPVLTRRVYIISKAGPYLKIDKMGAVSGTYDSTDPDAIFIIESMGRGVIRLKGENSKRYICFNKNKRIISRKHSVTRCLLRQYLEENYYILFWSYKYSKQLDGESGLFLALRKNGVIRKPAKTKIGDISTFFHVHYIE